MIEARRGIGGWLYFYNEERLHQALGYRTPRAVFAGEACEPVDNPPLRDALLRVIHMLRGTTSGEGGINVLTQVKHGLYWGGGSSINWMAWARGHKNDWDYFASEAGDPAWNYESVLNTYLRIEDWHGAPDPKYRDRRGQSEGDLQHAACRRKETTPGRADRESRCDGIDGDVASPKFLGEDEGQRLDRRWSGTVAGD